MSNQLATLSNLAGALTSATQAIATSAGNECYMRFTKTGEWIFGADEVETEQGAKWAVNPESFVQGFQAWDNDNNLKGEEYALVTAQPILLANLPDVGAVWKPLIGCQLVCLDGEDAGQQVLFKVTSVGGTKTVSGLMRELIKRLNSPEIANGHVPVVELDCASYKHKKYGKIFTPTMRIVDWSKNDIQKEPEPEPEEEKVAEKVEEEVEEVAEIAEEVEEVEEKPKTARRRRRVTA